MKLVHFSLDIHPMDSEHDCTAKMKLSFKAQMHGWTNQFRNQNVRYSIFYFCMYLQPEDHLLPTEDLVNK